MFSNGEINRDFALDAYKLKRLVDDGLVKRIISNELRHIISGCYESFYANSVSIDLYDGENSAFELRLISGACRSEILSTNPNEIFILPIAGKVQITEYTISNGGKIMDSGAWEMGNFAHFIGKSSLTKKFYDFNPTDDTAILLFGTSKKNNDDIYINYHRESNEIKEIVSNDLTESRLEFWMTFYNELAESIDKRQAEKLLPICKSRKLKGYIAKEFGL
ncbi:hypothetical protein [Aeromonas veronii]|uniref:hypothetical protein n=1 Tax=Aeromonas veronii TaxID=654 RepID=UPI001119C33A|nr:hypothetical protein [Aeromonas veronii]TNI11190.1 hypothetical protein CF106_15620 [Aeromonas veronii]